MGLQDRDVPGHDISSAGNVATLQPAAEFTLTTIMENAGGSPDVAIQLREKGGTWRTFHTFTGADTVQDSRKLAAYEVRVRVTTAASGTADFYVAAAD